MVAGSNCTLSFLDGYRILLGIKKGKIHVVNKKVMQLAKEFLIRKKVKA